MAKSDRTHWKYVWRNEIFLVKYYFCTSCKEFTKNKITNFVLGERKSYIDLVLIYREAEAIWLENWRQNSRANI